MGLGWAEDNAEIVDTLVCASMHCRRLSFASVMVILCGDR
jgi:hypothetical protein